MTEKWPQSPARIATSRLRLDPLSVDDAAEMVGVLAGPDLYVFTGGEPPTIEALRARYERLVVGHSGDGTEVWLNWIVRRASDGAAVGTVQATVVDEGRHAEIAWVIGLLWQGQGFATEAAAAMVEWLRSVGVTSFTAHVHPDHGASIKVAERVGLQPTGDYVDGERVWRLTSRA